MAIVTPMAIAIRYGTGSEDATSLEETAANQKTRAVAIYYSFKRPGLFCAEKSFG